ncbi:hypothetical protein M758_2G027400 [Ceratodon purpureus]|uniref:Uncharacterized protein n=1 Tax=Ceratodon purpureus TaxID=3225 RepID=A0A8T0IS79_CERPU|nr:hypothetical protein KC19_2G027800 [Ceratodon purpureus]KAG0625094.1 hypothetical protein M758_2G027400 [Ceratodon purpureus]
MCCDHMYLCLVPQLLAPLLLGKLATLLSPLPVHCRSYHFPDAESPFTLLRLEF